MSAAATEDGEQALLEIRGLTVALPPDADRTNAVEDIHLSLSRNEVLCVVGESGSGKSVTAHAVMGLLPEPHVRIAGGEIVFEGQTITSLNPASWRDLRGRRMGMIFQEPMSALNPVMRIGAQIEEVLRAHTHNVGSRASTPRGRIARRGGPARATDSTRGLPVSAIWWTAPTGDDCRRSGPRACVVDCR